MGDSDQEFDRRKPARDKFKAERREYDGRDEVGSAVGGGPRPDNKRDYFDDRAPARASDYSAGGRRGGGGFYHGERAAAAAPFFPPQAGGDVPPFKRPRRDLEDGGSARKSDKEEYPSSQQSGSMKSFKHFLSQQDDNISEHDALQKYKEYKENFVRRQLGDFFTCHKEEEWFKEKYHPDFCVDRQRVANENVVKRLQIFKELLADNWCTNRPVAVDNSAALIKFMDALVIKLEGGSDVDLKILEVSDEVKEGNEVGKDEKSASESRMKKEVKKKRKTLNSDEGGLNSDSSSSSSSSSSESDSGEEEEGQHHRKMRRPKERRNSGLTAENVDPATAAAAVPQEEAGEDTAGDDDTCEGAEVDDGKLDDAASEEGETAVEDGEAAADDVKDPPTPTESEQPADDSACFPPAETAGQAAPGPCAASAVAPLPKPLHKTNSIFLRNLHPSITREDLELLCKSYPGFLRLALQDPAPERKFFRRGWVTFAPAVNIKEVCWNLNNIRLKDCDFGAIVNRELSQRVRPVGLPACHRPVMRADVQLAARLVQQLDRRRGLWQPEEAAADAPAALAFSIVSANPLLKNITDHLVEEGSYEEQLLGTDTATTRPLDEVRVERDAALGAVIDRLVLYLRAVHSVDYYAAVEYPNEDEMPHRCGIVHARGAPGASGQLTQRELDGYRAGFELKVKHLMEHAEPLKDEDVARLGREDEAHAVEAFLAANTQELAKDKWLCPLSGKKFKGPEFVRKHIFNKHAESVEAVRKNVTFFNNYLRDPKRPQLPEHFAAAGGASRASHQHSDQRNGRHHNDRGYGGHYDRGHGHYEPHFSGGGGGGRQSGWYDYGGSSGYSSASSRSYGGYGGAKGGSYDRTGAGNSGYSHGGGGYDRHRPSSNYGRRPYGDRGYGDVRRGGGYGGR